MRRRAFTILEVLVMSAIALVIMGVGWSVFSAMTRQSKKLDARLRALQASQLVLERMKVDIKQHVHVEGATLVDVAPPALVLAVFREYLFVPGAVQQSAVRVDLVKWKFDPVTHYLSRNDEPMRFAQFESVTFSAQESKKEPKELRNSVTIDLTYVPEELLATPDRVTERDRIRFRAVVGLPYRTLIDAFPSWRENPSDGVSP